MKYKVGDRLRYAFDCEVFEITKADLPMDRYEGNWWIPDETRRVSMNVWYTADWVEGPMYDSEGEGPRFTLLSGDDTGPTEIEAWDEANEVRATAPSGAQKGRKPETYSLIPSRPLAEVARVYGYGATKYSPDNWRSGYPYSWSLDALMRHIEQFRLGEDTDPESGHEHLAHAAFHLFTLLEYRYTGVGEDDRFDMRDYA